ncbi:MAG TPA: hypothetical protein VK054_09515 [Beutenbergiaceae bacterium]|nr:hypothetical protein [Beutenbergiaceae bacterium]
MTPPTPFAPSEEELRHLHIPTPTYPTLPPPPVTTSAHTVPANKTALEAFTRHDRRFGWWALIGFWVALAITCLGGWLGWVFLLSPLLNPT